MRKIFIAFLIASLALAGATSCAKKKKEIVGASKTTTTLGPTTVPPTANSGSSNVTDTLSKLGYTTFVELATKAGVAPALQAAGPFTILAVSNSAFEKLPVGTLDALQADPSGKMAATLKLHVIPKKITTKELQDMNGKTIDTVSGEKLTVTVENGVTSIAGVALLDGGIPASNGIIHTMSGVITAAK